MSENTMLCYCKGVTLGKVLAAIENGATTLVEVIDVTGAGSGCGRCLDRIEAIINEEK
ncbi:(2Fe-2S)-binding protein [Cetobacterium somerae]|uniref:(2Fe-2S)-binding protein n=1 Tax=Cetobacterium sp. NK01 TaxID=2993530 RepID=UPI002115FE41|nr:(2Fe-2S)-binding protein [Cetobacterium sp. NK01]MCQ8213135.1 (2Fe-2S)-binding protein [Cetobacterium sp. NK01]